MVKVHFAPLGAEPMVFTQAQLYLLRIDLAMVGRRAVPTKAFAKLHSYLKLYGR